MARTEEELIRDDAHFEDCLKEAEKYKFRAITVKTFGGENRCLEKLEAFYDYAKTGDCETAEIAGDFLYKDEIRFTKLVITKSYYNWSGSIQEFIKQILS